MRPGILASRRPRPTRLLGGLAPHRALLGLLLLAAWLSLAGCQPGGGGPAGGAAEAGQLPGQILVSLGDGAGDFTTYAVRVTGLRLRRADGAVVEALAEPVTVDFAQYVRLAELVTAAAVPPGRYTGATLTLDYRDAEVRVESPAGEVVPATVVDGSGEPVQTLELRVRLEGRQALRVLPGAAAHLALDFDLEASHELRFPDPAGGGAALARVEPFLFAQVEAAPSRPHRLRGGLGPVMPARERFLLLLRPFHRPVGASHRPFGRIPVVVGEETAFEVDGQAYRGLEGLRALALLPPLSTPVVVVGRLALHPLAYQASEVYAGSSVPGAGLDAVRGHVVARSGERVTVAGLRTLRDGGLAFHVTVQVDLSDPQLRVLRQGGGCAEGPCDAGDVSVGQRVAAFGRWDAEQGVLHARRVRLLVTTARGLVRDPAALPEPSPVAPLVLALQGLDRLPAARFDFRGTGDLPAHDADPGAYEVATGALPLPAAGTPVQVRGFVHRFGAAPPDFDALAVVDLGEVAGRYGARWEPPAAGALTATPEALRVADDGAAAAGLWQGGVHTDLAADGQDTVLRPRPDGQGVFLIRTREGVVLLHTRFPAFAAALQERLAAGARTQAVRARGRPGGEGSGLEVRRIAVVLR